MRTGLLLIGHGTRSERGQAELRATAALVARQLPDVHVQECFLELASPPIDEGIERLAAQGVERIVALPLLLLAAGHAKEDIPAAIAAAAQNFPRVEFRLAAHLGCAEHLLELSALRFREAIAGREEVPLAETMLVMVGRGTHDASALAEMRAFVQRRSALMPVGQVQIAYVAMAQPRLTEVLPGASAAGFRRVVIQPHLLFHGELLERVAEQVAAVARPPQDWVVAPHLGPHELLAQAIAARFDESR